MSGPLQPPLSREEYDRNVEGLLRDVEERQKGLDLAMKRLAWWQEGRSLYFGESVSTDSDSVAEDDAGDDEVATRAALNGTSTLRQAVLAVFLDRRPTNGIEPTWKAGEVVEELRKRDAMPESADYGESIVRKMLRSMAEKKQLMRHGYGSYSLAEGVRQGRRGAVTARGPGDLQRQIMRILGERPKATPTELFNDLTESGVKGNKGSIHNSLARLSDLGLVERAAPGEWRLARREAQGDEET